MTHTHARTHTQTHSPAIIFVPVSHYVKPFLCRRLIASGLLVANIPTSGAYVIRLSAPESRAVIIGRANLSDVVFMRLTNVRSYFQSRRLGSAELPLLVLRERASWRCLLAFPGLDWFTLGRCSCSGRPSIGPFALVSSFSSSLSACYT